ncbi:MAG: RNA polymerase sigma factor [Planctomycetota bacterium]
MELDPQILDRALNGDRDAFHDVASQCWGLVFVFVRQRVKDQEFARDLAQETFLSAYAKRETLRSEESFVSWLLTIAARKIIDFRRRRSVRPETRLSDEMDPPEDGAMAAAPAGSRQDTEVEASDEFERLHTGLDRLTDQYRTVLILRYWSGLTPAQISRLLSEPEGTIRNRIFRAHARLRTALEEPTQKTPEDRAGATLGHDQESWDEDDKR